ncbi:hypothetical protein D3C78_1632460 [compost metagenome]
MGVIAFQYGLPERDAVFVRLSVVADSRERLDFGELCDELKEFAALGFLHRRVGRCHRVIGVNAQTRVQVADADHLILQLDQRIEVELAALVWRDD